MIEIDRSEMNPDELSEKIARRVALTMMRGVTASFLREAQSLGLTADDLADFDHKRVDRIGGILWSNRECEFGPCLDFGRREAAFIMRHSIRPLFLTDDDYPRRLAEIEDAPMMLYVLGDADLDGRNMAAFVGTRKVTPPGVAQTRRLVKECADRYPELTTVSGLAYGVDAAAHEASLEAACPTVAVLAHGLDMIYPAQHRNLAKRILEEGGALVSEYVSGTRPYRGRFLERNRIIAELSVVVVVTESNVRGGAMATARYARSYDREVLAVPGRLSDEMSSGCNLLIKNNVAAILTQASDIGDAACWPQPAETAFMTQRSLFPELEGDNLEVYKCMKALGDGEPIAFDVIHRQSGLSVSQTLGVLSELEFEDIVARHPGNRFSLLR